MTSIAICAYNDLRIFSHVKYAFVQTRRRLKDDFGELYDLHDCGCSDV